MAYAVSMTYQAKAETLRELLGLDISPLAITFCDEPPAGVARVDAPAAAGCGYWRAAIEDRVFHTTAPDHHGCPVGAHTHRVDLPDDVAAELGTMIGTMVQLRYLEEADVATIPQRQTPLRHAVYAPLGKTPCAPDVVLVRAEVRQLMLLTEAAALAGVGGEAPTMGRPTCAVLPQALNTGRTASSFGCIGNRVYTGAGDGEGYFAIPGAQLDVLLDALTTIAAANTALESFHRARAASCAS
jgi:uncharacterized protein (DUF169 family)